MSDQELPIIDHPCANEQFLWNLALYKTHVNTHVITFSINTMVGGFLHQACLSTLEQHNNGRCVA